MERPWVFPHADVLAGGAKPGDVVAAGCGQVPIICSAEELPERCACNVEFTDKPDIAERVKWQMCGDVRSLWSVKVLEAPHAGIECRAAAAREAHHGNARRINPLMSHQRINGAIGIVDLREQAQLSLILTTSPMPRPLKLSRRKVAIPILLRN